VKKIGRREFLKFVSALSGGIAASRFLTRSRALSSDLPNIIIIVLDALSARNMSLHGYRRNTTPNIERLAQRANVYHAHHSGGTFTTAGTASLPTGTYPWTHRAINIKGLVNRSVSTRNIFNLFNSHRRVAFTQNYLADYLLTQFEADLDRHLPIGAFSRLEQYMDGLNGNDPLVQFRANTDLLFDRIPGSLVLGVANKYRKINIASELRKTNDNLQQYRDDLFFYVQDVFSGLASELRELESPSLFYAHLYPPHDPYKPQEGFDEMFADSWRPVEKPRHPLWKEHSTSRKTLNGQRRLYDQYLANTDFAFGEFLDQLEKSGVLKNSYLILTSDHGESFERGYLGHAGPYMYEPSVHIPLLISTPGQTERRDFYSATNSVDVLPTLLDLCDYDIPAWCEGSILPGFDAHSGVDSQRVTFSVDAKTNSAFGRLSAISIAMRRENFKLIYYKGYNDSNTPYHDGVFELYNLENDLEEMNDLVNFETSTAHELRELLPAAYAVGGRPL